jgi:hypothetical protein
MQRSSSFISRGLAARRRRAGLIVAVCASCSIAAVSFGAGPAGATPGPPMTSVTLLPAPTEGKVTAPATVVLTASAGAGVLATEFSLDGGAFQPYAGPLAVAALGEHAIEYRSTAADGAIETAKKASFTVVAPPPACAEPHLAIAVSHPLRGGKGQAVLRLGQAYEFTGRLSCGSRRSSAPLGTAIEVISLVGKKALLLPGLALGPGGKIGTLMRFSHNQTVAFRYAGEPAAEARIRVTVVHH